MCKELITKKNLLKDQGLNIFKDNLTHLSYTLYILFLEFCYTKNKDCNGFKGN